MLTKLRDKALESLTFTSRNSKADKQPSDELDSAPSNKDTTSSYLSNVSAMHTSNQPGLFGQTLLERIGVDCTARIEFDGPVTQEELEKLIALIKLNADVFPTKG